MDIELQKKTMVRLSFFLKTLSFSLSLCFSLFLFQLIARQTLTC